MDEFTVTYTYNLLFQWLKETLSVTPYNITIQSDKSKTTIVPVKNLKKIELKKRYSVIHFLLGFLLVYVAMESTISLNDLIHTIPIAILGAIAFLNGVQYKLVFHMRENAAYPSTYRIIVPIFERSKLQDAQRAIRAVMPYEPEKRKAIFPHPQNIQPVQIKRA
ncbi:hypothetical protein [Butyrivibrio sp. VCB2006]|uniref:hypothetical protein n=1 Tax=Butyrivibrio sp. VCB2006 TaxID=1280679 RepID=UPI0004927ABF|nr:hypothetical protein [Butyrivibrio sp. VCB2006]